MESEDEDEEEDEDENSEGSAADDDNGPNLVCRIYAVLLTPFHDSGMDIFFCYCFLSSSPLKRIRRSMRTNEKRT